MRRLAAAVGIGAVFLANLDACAFTLAVPLLHRAFPAAPAGQLSLVQTGYGIGFAALILPAGQLTDRRGPRWPLLAGLAVFTTAAVLAAGPAVGRVTSISQVARQGGGAAGAVIAGAAIGGALTPGALDSGWAVLAVTAFLIVVLGRALTRSPTGRSS